MKWTACLVACLLLAGCAFTHIEEKRPDGTFYTMDSKVISVPDGFLAGVLSLAGELLKKQPTVKPPVTPPVVPPVENPDPLPPNPPVDPEKPPYKVGKIEDLHGTGFVWKPVSENTGKLVVLTPASWGVLVCEVYEPNGMNRIETGDYVGPTNTDRPTYRFTRPGADFPANCILSVGQRKYLVPDPAKRYD